MYRIPFKDKCAGFWPLNGDFKDMLGGQSLDANPGRGLFVPKEKCLKIADVHSSLTVPLNGIDASGTLIFQTKGMVYQNAGKPLDKCSFLHARNDSDIFQFDFTKAVSLIAQDRWTVNVVVYEENKTAYYIDGILVALKEESVPLSKSVTFNDPHVDDRVSCSGLIRLVGLYTFPFTEKEVRTVQSHRFYKLAATGNAVKNALLK